MKECKTNQERKKFTIQFYDKKWITFDLEKLKARLENARPLLEKILAIIDIRNVFTILDIGTGPGTIPIAIIEKYHSHHSYQIYGIDPSQISISVATKIIKNLGLEKKIIYKIGSFEEIPFPNNFFDLIVSNASFNLCTNKVKAINEISRVSKEAGQIIIVDCFKKREEHQCREESAELWSKCISGAITPEWLIKNANSKGLIFKYQEEITEIVRDLILNGKWNWKEFIDYDLEYHILKFMLDKLPIS